MMEKGIEPLLKHPVLRPHEKLIVWHLDFLYQAATWKNRRRLVAKVECYRENFSLRWFSLLSTSRRNLGVVRFYKGLGNSRAVDQGGKGRVEVDAADVPSVCGQP